MIRRLAAGATALAMVLAACSSNPATPGSSASSPDPTARVATPAGSALGARRPLSGFKEVTVSVRRPDGSVRDFCLLLADTEELRQQGLMRVSDPSLGGYPGMLFLFDRDEQGGFWMKNTLLPLSIAYVASDGSIVSSNDMDPCPPDEQRCPVYKADGSYRYAVEVPKGTLADVGLTGGATLTVGDKSCAAT